MNYPLERVAEVASPERALLEPLAPVFDAFVEGMYPRGAVLNMQGFVIEPEYTGRHESLQGLHGVVPPAAGEVALRHLFFTGNLVKGEHYSWVLAGELLSTTPPTEDQLILAGTLLKPITERWSLTPEAEQQVILNGLRGVRPRTAHRIPFPRRADRLS